MKKAISLLLSAVLCINTFMVFAAAKPICAQASTYTEQLIKDGFPESYVADLEALHKKYPNWIFKPFITGFDWNYAVSMERNPHSDQVIEKLSYSPASNYCKCASCFKNGNYVIQEKPDWVSASQETVEYYMDPRNWLNENGIFQFESTAYDGTQTLDGIEAILAGTWMHNSKITYKDSNGATRTVIYQNKDGSTTYPTYAQSILRAASYSGMSAYYLASKIRQEVGGTNPTAGGASGTNSTYPGIYNYYNIAAYTGANDGLKWASYKAAAGYFTNCTCRVREKATTNSKELAMLPANTELTFKAEVKGQDDGQKWYQISVNQNGKTINGYIRSDLVNYSTTGDKYGRPWTDPDKSIFYGARYISNNFDTQTSGYLQKFNVNPASSEVFDHEYMRNVAAAASESASTYKAYDKAGILGITKTFSIPVYKNMQNSGHNYSIKVIKQATSVEDGEIQKTCTKCGDTVKETVPKASLIKRSYDSIICVGTVQRPQVKVYDRTGAELKYKEDFDVEWENINSADVGEYSFSVKYKGKYAGTHNYKYRITQNNNPVNFTQARPKIKYTGTVQRSSVTATNNFNNALTYKKDFTVDYSDWNSTNVGKYQIVCSTAGANYAKSTKTMTYEIIPTDIAPVCTLSRTEIAYTGTVQRPQVTVKNIYGVDLEYKKDFTVEYSDWNSTQPGFYTVTVKFISGNYNVPDQTFEYGIVPKTTSFLTSAQGGFKAVSKGFTLTWNKQTGITGYQIQYATKSDFSNGAIIYAGSADANSKTITGRAGNTRYYVRIRTYKNIGGRYLFSNWSTGTKSVVTLK